MNPSDHHFRRQTEETHHKMAGVTLPSFRCTKCKQTKMVTGRKQIIPGAPKFGYVCAECAA